MNVKSFKKSFKHIIFPHYEVWDALKAETPFKSDEKSGKVGRTFPDF